MSQGEHKHHILPLTTYLAVGVALLVLTALTVAASTIDMGAWNAAVAFALAGTKALLVALVFMHLRFDRKIYLVIFGSGIVFLAVMIGLTMFDVLRRGDIDTITDGPIQTQAGICQTAPTDSATVADSATAAADSAGSEADSAAETSGH